MKFTDESGWIRAVVCCAALLIQHGLRDTMLTALPSLALNYSSVDSKKIDAWEMNETPEYAVGLLDVINSSDSENNNNNVLKMNETLEYDIGLLGVVNSNGSENNYEVLKISETSDYAELDVINSSYSDYEIWKTSDAPEYDIQSDLNSSEVVKSEEKSSIISQTSIPSDEIKYKLEDQGLVKESPLSRSVLNSPPNHNITNSNYNKTSTDPQRNRGEFEERQNFQLSTPSSQSSLQENWRENERPTRVRRDASAPRNMQGSGVVSGVTYGTEDNTGGQYAIPLSVVEGHGFGLDKIMVRDGTPQYQPQYKEDWSVMIEGLIVSAVYWLWLIAAFIANPLLNRVGGSMLLGVSVGVSGVLGLFTHLASLGGPWPLLAFRIIQGAFQGVAYPAVVRILEGVPNTSRTSMALLVLIGGYIGTSFGSGMGSVEAWYSGFYVMGSLALIITPLCIFLPSSDNTKHKDMGWTSVLTCRGVWAVVGVHAAHTWLLHTLLFATPIALTHASLYTPSWSGCGVCVVMLGVLVIAIQPLLPVSLISLINNIPSALNRRRAPVVFGCILVTTATIVLATAGMDSVSVLLGVAGGLGGVGVGFIGVSVRANIEDLAPMQLWRLVRLLDMVAVLVAALTPLPIAALIQNGDSGWIGVWLIPLAGIVPATLVYIFLLTTNSQPWDKAEVDGIGGVGVAVNGVGPPRSVASKLSFKTARSAHTFKTAMSRPRTRTVSCRTIDDDLTDMYSAAGDEGSIDCHSVVEEPEPECISVVSSNSFKSDGADMHSVMDGSVTGGGPHARQVPAGQQFGSMLVNGGVSADRTHVWLSSHHQLDITSNLPPFKPEPQDKKELKSKNSIYHLFW